MIDENNVLLQKAEAAIAEDDEWYRDEVGLDWAVSSMPAARAFIAACSPRDVIALLHRIDQCEMQLARASGVLRSKGETAYADDCMRVAMDRDDFDAQVTEASP